MAIAVGRERFEELLRFNMTSDNLSRTMYAYQLSKYAHRGQSRDDGTRYFEHPKNVALILIVELGIYDHEMIIVALLHDSEEDSFIFGDGLDQAWDNVRVSFSEWVANSVRVLTKIKCTQEEKPERDAQYFAAIAKADLRTKIIKLVDRMHNVRDLRNCTPEKQARYVEETEGHFITLAQEIMSASPVALRRKVKKLHDEMSRICSEVRKSLLKSSLTS